MTEGLPFPFDAHAYSIMLSTSSRVKSEASRAINNPPSMHIDEIYVPNHGLLFALVFLIYTGLIDPQTHGRACRFCYKSLKHCRGVWKRYMSGSHIDDSTRPSIAENNLRFLQHCGPRKQRYLFEDKYPSPHSIGYAHECCPIALRRNLRC